MMANIQPVPRNVKQKMGLLDRLLVHLALWRPLLVRSEFTGWFGDCSLFNYTGFMQQR
jgi:hypothetical protein